jgi:hypothetical protein
MYAKDVKNIEISFSLHPHKQLVLVATPVSTGVYFSVMLSC